MTTRKKQKSSFPPYAQAKATAIDLQLRSSTHYREWHRANKIKYLPCFPERVYKEWVSWNDYLGTNNIFMGDRQVVRPYWDAVKWAQEFASLHEMETIQDWHLYWKEHKEDMPKDIPLNPDAKYKGEWVDWKTWLGTDVRGRVLAAKVDTALLCICTRHSLAIPGNVYDIIQAERGESELRSVLTRDTELRVVRCYKMENELKEQVMEIFSRWGRHDAIGRFVGWYIPNINEVLFELDGLLLPFTGK